MQKLPPITVVGFWLLSGLPLLAQAPIVSAVLNNASSDPRLSPGLLAAIFGSNLSNGSCRGAVPLPATLCDTQVTVGGKNAAIAVASPTQVNVQLPTDAALGSAEVVVTRQGVVSNRFGVTIDAASPAISNLGQGNPPLAIATRANNSVISPTNPPVPGEVIGLSVAGLGATNPSVATGAAPPSNPLAVTVNTPKVTIGGKTGEVLFSGLLPGFPGGYQINFRLPEDLSDGNQAVQVEIAGKTSNQALIPVRRTVLISSVLNTATFELQAPIVPGMLVGVFASNFGTQQNLEAFPATTFNGASVTFNGIAAPLVHVVPAAGQINLVVPAELPETGDVNVVLRAAAGVSQQFTVRMASAAPAMFRVGDPSNASRKNAALVLANTRWILMPLAHARALQIPADCAANRIDPASTCGQPAFPGDVATLFLTGLGKSTPNGDPAGTPLKTGTIAPASGNPLYTSVVKPLVTVGDVPAEVLFSGIAPGQIIHQINFKIPDSAPLGDDVALKVTHPGGRSDTATLAIRARSAN